MVVVVGGGRRLLSSCYHATDATKKRISKNKIITMDDGRWRLEMEDGRWTDDGGRWTATDERTTDEQRTNN